MRACKVDSNQAEVVKALRSAGATVQLLHAVGKGCPDLLIGHLGQNMLAEVKDGGAPKNQQKLTGDQEKWHAGWRGAVTVIRSVDDAMKLLQGMSERAMR